MDGRMMQDKEEGKEGKEEVEKIDLEISLVYTLIQSGGDRFVLSPKKGRNCTTTSQYSSVLWWQHTENESHRWMDGETQYEYVAHTSELKDKFNRNFTQWHRMFVSFPLRLMHPEIEMMMVVEERKQNISGSMFLKSSILLFH